MAKDINPFDEIDQLEIYPSVIINERVLPESIPRSVSFSSK